MSNTFRISGLAVLPALALAACSDTQAPLGDEDAIINADVAHYVAENTSDDIVMMTTEAEFVMLPGFVAHRDCQQGPLSKIRCAARKFSGSASLEITREVTFYDTTGVIQDGYDRLATESINHVVSISGSREGTRNGGTFTMSVDRERNFTVSGLGGEEIERTWNGTGSADLNRTRKSDENGDRAYDMSSTTEVEDVVIAVPRAGTWPKSGTITRHVTVEIISGLEDPTTRERTVIVTFDGTQFATIEINGETFTLDLETRELIEN